MTDPARLLAGEATEFERLLLETAAREEPTQEMSSVMLAGLSGAAISSTAISGTATGGAPVGGLGGGAELASGVVKSGGVLWKWVASAISIGVVGGAVWGLSPSPETPPLVSPPGDPPEAAQVVAAPEEPALAPQPAVAEVPGEEPAELTPPAKTPAKRQPTTDPLSAELRILDAARAALARDDAARTLSLLNTYARQFPSGTLREEATVLKVKALEARGRSQEADSLKDDFRKQHPNSAHNQRLNREP